MQVDVLMERPEPNQPPGKNPAGAGGGGSTGQSDQVRRHTPARINQRIDEATMKRVWQYAHKPPAALAARIQELDREWDLERILETGAGTLALTGVLMSGLKSRRWLLVSASILTLLLQHSLTRTSPLSDALRAFGVRTRREIDAEKYAMRMLRGDFDNLKSVSEETHRAIEALRLSRP
jgi:hypothetical protein